MTFTENLKKYSNLILEEGLKIKKGDYLVIRGQVEMIKFIRLLTETAYKLGAKDVKINFRDEYISKIRYENASIETLEEVPQYFIDEQNSYMDKKAKILSIIGNDPNLLADVNPTKIKASIISTSKALRDFNAKMMNSEISWCVVGAAVPSWAKVVFPDIPTDEAMKKLWDLIFYTVRADKDDPVEIGRAHV